MAKTALERKQAQLERQRAQQLADPDNSTPDHIRLQALLDEARALAEKIHAAQVAKARTPEEIVALKRKHRVDLPQIYMPVDRG